MKEKIELLKNEMTTLTVMPLQVSVDITPKIGQPWYQFKKEFYEYWSYSPFRPSYSDVFQELKSKGIPNDFKGKGKRNKKK